MAQHPWMSEQIYLDQSLFRNSSVHYWWHLLSLCFWKNLLTTFFHLAVSSYRNFALLNVGFRSCISSASVVPGNRWFIALSLQILVFLSLFILLKGWSVLLSTCRHVITLSHTSIKPTTVVFMRKVSSVQQCSSVMSFSFSVIMELGGTEELTEAFDTQTILVSESIVANKIRKM